MSTNISFETWLLNSDYPLNRVSVGGDLREIAYTQYCAQNDKIVRNKIHDAQLSIIESMAKIRNCK